ncbi:hypothetical protein Mapa_006318 [Marchantia paleacea]|nr:hypothetical protein Mapa_006318 [Marchantia paleacea]
MRRMAALCSLAHMKQPVPSEYKSRAVSLYIIIQWYLPDDMQFTNHVIRTGGSEGISDLQVHDDRIRSMQIALY